MTHKHFRLTERCKSCKQNFEILSTASKLLFATVCKRIASYGFSKFSNFLDRVKMWQFFQKTIFLLQDQCALTMLPMPGCEVKMENEKLCFRIKHMNRQYVIQAANEEQQAKYVCRGLILLNLNWLILIKSFLYFKFFGGRRNGLYSGKIVTKQLENLIEMKSKKETDRIRKFF